LRGGREREKRSILIVDDDSAHRLMLRETVSSWDMVPVEAGSGKEALDSLGSETVDLVLLDVKMPGMGGLEALKQIKAINPALPVIMMTAFATVQTAVDALKLGAGDYLVKPLDTQELRDAVNAAILSPDGMEPEEASPLPELEGLDLVAASSVMKEVVNEAVNVAATDATVLLTGESGSGKEVVAEIIHQLSPRSARQIMSVNCAAIPENLIESEMFGHVKGAFTGADRDREGRFQAAEGGTLFLDEIGELPLPAQAKLLRVLQAGKVTPVGGTREVATDVRIVAATNRNLEHEVGEGRFRVRPLLPDLGDSHPHTSTQGEEDRHPPAGRAFSETLRWKARYEYKGVHPGSTCHAFVPRLAGQRARTDERHREGRSTHKERIPGC